MVATSPPTASPTARAPAAADMPRARLADLPWPAVAYLLAVLLPLQFSLGPLAMTPLRALLLVLIVPLTIGLLSGRYGRLLWIDILFFLHVGWIALAMAMVDQGRMVQHVGSHAVEFIGGYVVARAFIRTLPAFMALVKWLVLLAVLLLPMALFESLTGRNLFFELGNALPAFSVPGELSDPRMGLFRARTAFPHAILHGLFVSTLFALVFVGLKGTLDDTRRWIAAAAVATGTLLSLSSGPMLGLQLQLGLIAWAALTARYPQRWLLLLGLLALAYIAVDLLSNRSPYRVFISRLTLNPDTGYWRDLILQHGLANVRDNPLFGLGLADWERPAFMHSGSVDNFWLLLTMRYGVPGFLFLIAGFLGGLLAVALRDLGTAPQLLRARLAWVFAFVGLGFTLTTVHVWGAAFSFVFFLFGAGIWLLTTPPQAAVGSDTAAPTPADPPNGTAAWTRPARLLPWLRAPAAPRSSAPLPPRSAAPPRPHPPYTRFPSAPHAPPPLSSVQKYPRGESPNGDGGQKAPPR